MAMIMMLHRTDDDCKRFCLSLRCHQNRFWSFHLLLRLTITLPANKTGPNYFKRLLKEDKTQRMNQQENITDIVSIGFERNLFLKNQFEQGVSVEIGITIFSPTSNKETFR